MIPGIVAGRAVAHTAWTPAALSPYAWWNDDSSVTADSGRAQEWENIGATSYDIATNSTANGPTINATGLNGRRTLTFSATNERMRNNDSGALRAVFQNQSGGWVFAVARRRNVDGAPTARHLFAVSTGTAGGDAGGGSRFVAGLGQGAINTPALLARRLDADSTGVLNGSSAIGTDWSMILWQMDWGSGSGSIHLNGELDAANMSLTSSGDTSNTQSQRAVFIGGFPSNTGGGSGIVNPADCDLAEIVVHRGALAAGDIDRLFGYAAHRWGLASELDALHPYKSSPP